VISRCTFGLEALQLYQTDFQECNELKINDCSYINDK
jgi:hypothetical protein